MLSQRNEVRGLAAAQIVRPKSFTALREFFDGVQGPRPRVYTRWKLSDPIQWIHLDKKELEELYRKEMMRRTSAALLQSWISLNGIPSSKMMGMRQHGVAFWHDRHRPIDAQVLPDTFKEGLESAEAVGNICVRLFTYGRVANPPVGVDISPADSFLSLADFTEALEEGQHIANLADYVLLLAVEAEHRNAFLVWRLDGDTMFFNPVDAGISEKMVAANVAASSVKTDPCGHLVSTMRRAPGGRGGREVRKNWPFGIFAFTTATTITSQRPFAFPQIHQCFPN